MRCFSIRCLSQSIILASVLFIAFLIPVFSQPAQAAWVPSKDSEKSPDAIILRAVAAVPFDPVRYKFDLHNIDTFDEERDTIYEYAISIPYSDLQYAGSKELRAVIDDPQQNPFKYTYDDFDPDVKINVGFDGQFAVKNRIQPIFSQAESGIAANRATLKIKMDDPLKTSLKSEAKVKVKCGLMTADAELDAEIFIDVGFSTTAKLYPEVHVKEFTPTFNVSSSDVDIDGLEGEVAWAGAAAGALAFTIIGGDPITGALVGSVTLNRALKSDKVQNLIDDKVTESLNKQKDKLQKKITKKVTQWVRVKAENLEEIIRNKNPLLGNGTSADELLDLLGAKIVVMSKVEKHAFKTAVSANMEDVPGNATVRGTLIFPSKKCGHTATGGKYVGMALAKIVEINKDLKDKTCAELLKPSGDQDKFRARFFVGRNPFDPEKSSRWKNWKNLSTKDAVPRIGRNGAYECDFNVSNLPAAAILELHAEGALADDLLAAIKAKPDAFRVRVLSLGGMLLNAKGESLNITRSGRFRIGDIGPEDESECPSGEGRDTAALQPLPDIRSRKFLVVDPVDERIRVVDVVDSAGLQKTMKDVEVIQQVDEVPGVEQIPATKHLIMPDIQKRGIQQVMPPIK
jgi:hypothetical protein